jgi:hypothetical protein
LKNCHRPFPIERFRECGCFGWQLTLQRFIQRVNRRAAAALLRATLVPLVPEKTPQDGEKKRAEFAATALHSAERGIRHQVAEKRLGLIFRIFAGPDGGADGEMNGPPIKLAEFSHRAARGLIPLQGRLGNDRPTRIRK